MCSKPTFRNQPHRRDRGFSFIEVMVVVVIIGILAGAVALKVKNNVDMSKISRAKSDIATIMTAVENYYVQNGEYPSNEDGLSKLDITDFNDPWGRAYQYNHPGQEADFEVISYGRDGLEGGEGIDGDVVSWRLNKSE